jgi:hypothetical protein
VFGSPKPRLLANVSSCLQRLTAGNTESATYNLFQTLKKNGGVTRPMPVVCDQTTDGGGWTLVGAGAVPPGAFASPLYPDLSSLQPALEYPFGSRPGVWSDLQLLNLNNLVDVRFTCTLDVANQVGQGVVRYDVRMVWRRMLCRAT